MCLHAWGCFCDRQDNQPWDLRCEDIELESTIAAGGAGSVIAATYNGFDVAVKVSSLRTRLLIDCARTAVHDVVLSPGASLQYR